MKITPTQIPDVLLITPKVHGDHRGFFMETWNARAFAELGLDLQFVQDNHSRSQLGTLRGLHYQIRQPQGKLVRVTVGEVFDVVVDMRRSSATFGHWVGERLSAENKRMLWVPPGFAHGFLVLSEAAEFQYKCTDYYAPEHERTLRWDDGDLGIEWPLNEGERPLLSKKDASGVSLGEAEAYP
ncbi:MAG: dTDP-4-dehydrorhamnose 3,5-epimerase [Spiribacter salinus]|uniref:dTDP-4-dehydrorhamnose 3,5-epimerase n=1 Tax=Spiribacter salinus TaxID=1335746 RepID=A0A540VQX9_9GAMM|nr:MAG: dTDP-4-dehydrorhamnose 3,5-epimerase [Spiribacter salinus]